MYRRTAVMIVLLGGALQNVAAASKKVAAAVRADSPRLPLAPSAISNAGVWPATISFTATDPDLGSFSGNSGATVFWTTNNGNTSNTWTLGVAASTASFSSCATVPASAITVSCNPGATNGQCGASFKLTTTAQQIASGKEAAGNGALYWVGINFTLADSWRFVAEQSPACTLDITYTINAP